MVTSAGVICYQVIDNILQVLLVHSTGNWPYWSFPKGLIEQHETIFNAARREFEEETSITLSPYLDDYQYLGNINATRKVIHAFAINQYIDPKLCKSNQCEFPKGSGIYIDEIDGYKWYSLSEAMNIINPKQKPLLERLVIILQEIL